MGAVPRVEPGNSLQTASHDTRSTELHCILLSYAATFNTSPFWAIMHPLGYTASYRARLHTTELRCTLLNYAISSELHCILTELPPIMIFFRMLDCLTVRHPVSMAPKCKEVLMPEPILHWNKKTHSECPVTGLRWWMPECQCQQHRPQCRCPAMHFTLPVK